MNPTQIETWSEIGSGIAEVSWRTGAVILGLALLRVMVRGRIPAQLWFAVWVVVALRLLLPFSFSTAWSPFNWVPASEAMVAPVVDSRAAAGAAVVTVEREMGGSHAVLASGNEAMASVSVWTWRELALVGWLVGVVVLAGLRFVVAAKFRRQLRSARTCEDRRWLAIVAEEARASGWGEAVTCLETNAVDAPALCGWFRPRLLIPTGFAGKLTDEDLRWVVRHELGHWRRKDLVAQRMMQAAVVLHWFNPLVWLAARLARADCELACDEFVLKRRAAGGGEAYGAALLKVLGVVRVQRRPLAVVGILETRRQLANRIRLIAGYRRAGFGSVLGGVLIVAFVAAVSGTRETRAAVVAATVAEKAPEPVAKEKSPISADEQARIKEGVRTKLEASRKAFEVVRETVDAQRKRVEQLADQLYDYKKKNNLLSLDERANLMEEKLGPARFAVFRAEKEWAQAKAEAERAAPSAKVETEGAVVAARRSVELAQTELEGLSQEAAQIARAQTVLPQLERELKIQSEVLREVASRALGAREPILARSPQALEWLQANFSVASVDAKPGQSEISGAGAAAVVVSAELPSAARTSAAIAASLGSPQASVKDESAAGVGGVIVQAERVVGEVTDPNVKERLVYVAGQVMRPGNFALPIGARITPAALILQAGGLTEGGDSQRMLVSRTNPHTRGMDRYPFRLVEGSIADGGGAAESGQFVLQPGDIIYVPDKKP